MKIENGVHNIPNEVYHNSSGVSRSGLWELKRSPYHYWNKYLNPDYVRPEPTAQMILGSVVHTMALEPHLFNKEYIVKPEIDPLPKVGLLKELGREEYDRQKSNREAISAANDLLMDEFKNESEGKTIITKDMFDQAFAMKEALYNNETFNSLMGDAYIEQSIYFTHEPTGLQCKARPDIWTGSIVTDLKTTFDASYKAFQSAAHNKGYFLQAGMIYKALQSIGITMEKFVFMCVENKAPCPTATYVLDDDAVEYGINIFDELMGKLKECCEQDRWPSYELKTLSVPAYAWFDVI